MTTPPPVRSSRGRSPSYPAVPLDAAIGRARVLYEREGRNAAPVAAIQAHWGYKPGTGPASTTLAAVKKFGLLLDEGSGDQRVGRLSDLAMEILLNPEPAEAIQRAALTPKIHRELWNSYRGTGLPSDATLRYELVRNREFTETGAAEFIAQFRKTLNFAQLDAAATLPEESIPGSEGAGVAAPVHPQAPAGFSGSSPAAMPQGTMTIPVPLPGSPPVQIVGQFPMPELAWDHFMRVLEAMKPGLIKPTFAEAAPPNYDDDGGDE